MKHVSEMIVHTVDGVGHFENMLDNPCHLWLYWPSAYSFGEYQLFYLSLRCAKVAQTMLSTQGRHIALKNHNKG